MKDFLELCRLRRSVRQYSEQSIPEEALNYIMECVRLAPSACNRQPWIFRFCTSAEDLEKLRICYDRPWFSGVRNCFLVIRKKSEEWVRKYDNKPHGDIDVAIAIEHLCLAAAEKGLGSCWICAFDAELCKKLFALPDDCEPVALVPIGYPTDEVAGKGKERKSLDEIWER